MNNKKYYITSAIPYVNSKPHLGHALEFIQTNTFARYQKILGKNVLTLCGSDENALKNVQSAKKANLTIQKFIDKNNTHFINLTKLLNAKYDIWQRGSDTNHHFPSSQKLWELCKENGDIYKKKYQGLYCVGCESFYSINELNKKNECFEHPGKKLNLVKEQNYFFKLSRYQNQLIKLINSDKLKIIPQKRKNEVLSFLKSGLKDISISRSNKRSKNWGVPVPKDKTQRIYVWFDALNIYQSGIGFGYNHKKYQKWWPAEVQVVGKGIIRFHAVYWPAFLLSAKLKIPKSIFVHEYITINNFKMSKTIGNVYNPIPLLKKHGPDPLRYFLLAKISPFLDGDFSEEKFYLAYNSDLANGLGNTVSRLSSLCQKSLLKFNPIFPTKFTKSTKSQLDKFRFDLALSNIWKSLSKIDKKIETSKPWQQKGKQLHTTLNKLITQILQVGFDLQPFLPDTSKKIIKQFSNSKITNIQPLFPRI